MYAFGKETAVLKKNPISIPRLALPWWASLLAAVLTAGAITLLASAAGPYLGDSVIAEMNTVGSLLLLGLGGKSEKDPAP